MDNVVEVWRGERLESVHAFHGVVAGLSGETAATGDPGFSTYWRSAMKPFQAIPLVRDGAASSAGFGLKEIALASASHGGTEAHVELARDMLKRIGLEESDLECGPHWPYDRTAAENLVRAGVKPGRLHNNCSGKHSGILSLCVFHGWPTDGYSDLNHPVQKRVRSGLEEWIEPAPDDLAWAVDGCGVPTPFLPLAEMARALHRLLTRTSVESAAGEIVSGMVAHPALTSSPGRIPCRLMQASEGRLLAKEGAEGLLSVGSTDEGWGLALKVIDGSLRATGPAVVELLCALDLLLPAEVDRLAAMRRPEIRNTRGEVVGEIRASVHPRSLPAIR